MSKEDIDNLFDAVDLPESDSKYRAIYIRNNHPWWLFPPKLSIWQKIYYFIVGLFKLKHTRRWFTLPYAPSRTASYEEITGIMRVVYRRWEPNDST